MYNIHQQCPNIFELLENWKSSKNNRSFNFLFYYMYNYHDSCFVNFIIVVNVANGVFLYFYIYYIYTHRGQATITNTSAANASFVLFSEVALLRATPA